MLTRLESLESQFFFSIPGKEFLDFRESRLTRPSDNRPIVSGIIVTGRSALAISRSLVASRRPWPAYQTHGRRRRETKDSGVSSGRRQREQMFLPPWADNHSYATESARQCKYCQLSLQQERSQFTAALEQTSNVPTTRNVGQSSGRVQRRACSLPHPASGRRSRPSVALHVWFWQVRHGARDPATARHFTCPSRPQRWPTVLRRPTGEAVIPRPIVWGRWLLLSPGRFGCASAGYVDRPQAAIPSSAGNGAGPASDHPSPLRAPAGDPTPITQVKVCTRAKSRVSIETPELRLLSRECDFPGINIPQLDPRREISGKVQGLMPMCLHSSDIWLISVHTTVNNYCKTCLLLNFVEKMFLIIVHLEQWMILVLYRLI